MNWTAIGAGGEILGAIGVIISLVYLATQVRQNTRVARAASRQALASDMQTLASDLVRGEDLARLFQAHLDGKPLESHELLRLQARAFRDFRFWDNAYFQYRQGLLTDDEWRGLRENLKLLLQVRVYRDYWPRERTLYSTAFQDEVGRMLSEALEAPPGELIFDRHREPRRDQSPD